MEKIERQTDYSASGAALTPSWLKRLRASGQPLLKRASRSYVAGPQLSSALQVCRRFAQQGWTSAIAYWNGENEHRRLVADANLDALAALAAERWEDKRLFRPPLDCYLSLKAPALGLSAALVTEIAARSRTLGVGLHFDMQLPETAEATWALTKHIARSGPPPGCTLPGRWRRSREDAELAVKLGLRVRVVKGQWADPLQPRVDLRAGFLAVVEQLAGRAAHVAIATHDPPLVRTALHRLCAAGTPCELELLYGLPLQAPARVAAEFGVPLRLYIPYGSAWLPYRLAQVRENPRIIWWVLRDTLFHRQL